MKEESSRNRATEEQSGEMGQINLVLTRPRVILFHVCFPAGAARHFLHSTGSLTRRFQFLLTRISAFQSSAATVVVSGWGLGIDHGRYREGLALSAPSSVLLAL